MTEETAIVQLHYGGQLVGEKIRTFHYSMYQIQQIEFMRDFYRRTGRTEMRALFYSFKLNYMGT